MKLGNAGSDQLTLNRHTVMVGMTEDQLAADGEAARNIDMNELQELLA